MRLTLAILALGLTASAQTTLPPNPASQVAPAASQVAPLAATPPVRDAATRAHRPEVLFANGLLSVNAQNASLNAILREISRQTGMKITGGVREERVFGHYGPAAPSEIIATLLGGTGTNMLLRQTASATPEELILTPRSGGPTPPNPNAPGFNDDADSDDDHDVRRPFSQPVQQPATVRPVPVMQAPPQQINPSQPNSVLGDPRNSTPTASQFPTTNSVPTDSLPTPATATQQTPGIVDTPNQTVTVPANSTSAPAGGSKTPEQIFQELQQLRQQQQKTTTPQ